MKRILLIATVVLFSLSAKAQVTITKFSLITAGHEFIQFHDSNKIAIKQGGMGELTWDFKNLAKVDSTVSVAKNAGWNPSISALSPKSNIILQVKGEQDYTFLNVNDTSVIFEASAKDTGTGPLEVTDHGFHFLRFPITHDATQFNDTVLLSVELTYLGIVPGPGAPRIDSVRVEEYIAQEFRAVGHGKIEFPNSTFPDLLMVENINVIYSLVHAQIGGRWTAISSNYASQLGYNVGGDSSYRHMWWSDDNGKGLPVVQYEYDNGDTEASGTDFIPAKAELSLLNTATQVRVTVFPNPSSDKIHFDGVLNTNSVVDIYSINGALILSTQLVNGVLDVTELTAGNYVILVKNGNDVVSTEITKE